MSSVYFFCPVCSRRWGDQAIEAEMIIERCERHPEGKSSRQLPAMGLTRGNHNAILRREGRPIGRPRKVDKNKNELL